MFGVLCVHLWRPLSGLFLEPFKVKIKLKPHLPRSRKEEAKLLLFLPTHRLRINSPGQTHWGMWAPVYYKAGQKTCLASWGSTAPVVVAHSQGSGGPGASGFQSW